MALGAGFTSFPARRCFPFLAVGHSPSYRQRKRSLGSARDDDSGRTFFQRTLYTIQQISIPHAVISSAARNLPRTPRFLAPFAKGFPFSAITHTTLSPLQERSLDFARDDDTGIALYKHLRCTLRGIDPFPSHHFPTTKKPQPKLELFCVRKTYLPNCASMVPAATAVPITPATFGPIACISR